MCAQPTVPRIGVPRQLRRRMTGVHDVHCATHRGADNGWVVVNGTRFPDIRC